MDGARLSNAAVALGVSLSEITRNCGVDILSFGATKNGLMFGEAIVFFQPGLSTDLRYIRKQDMQLASKMRYIAAQFSAFLADDLWHANAAQANAMAARLAKKVSAINGIRIVYPVQANAVFAALPEEAISPLQERFPFYVWNDSEHVVRWMTSWDTREEDVDAFVSLISEVVDGRA
jgi:threonine aldolase